MIQVSYESVTLECSPLMIGGSEHIILLFDSNITGFQYNLFVIGFLCVGSTIQFIAAIIDLDISYKEYNKIKPGFLYGKYNLYLFNEKCSYNAKDCYDGLDRYNKCCYVYDNNIKIIKVRYADFPW